MLADVGETSVKGLPKAPVITATNVLGGKTYSFTSSQSTRANTQSRTAFQSNLQSQFQQPSTVRQNIFIQTNVPTQSKISLLSKTNVPVSTKVNVNVPTTVKTNVPVIVTRKFAFPLPLLPKGGGFGKLDFGFGSRQQKSYTPSFTAAVLGIKGKMPNYRSLKTGLGVRPLV